jgi:predicted nuclease of restriction endonuclease-like (RecB) superfamily
MTRRTKRKSTPTKAIVTRANPYRRLITDISTFLDQARRNAARSVNAILTATYWQIGRRIVEHEQGGDIRADYGMTLIERLAKDLMKSHGRGFSVQGLYKMRSFYLGWEILPTVSGKLEAKTKLPTLSGESIVPICQTASAISQTPSALSAMFPLSWSHYVRLLSVEKPHARAFYESEAIRGGWSVRQLDRQISTQFFERTAHSKNPSALLKRSAKIEPAEISSIEEELRNPYLLEFLNLKDEYSESDLEDALIQHLETFLLELGAGFTFVARQKRIRIGDEWYRIDLLLFNRRLRCLVAIDLKVGKFTHADAGQMNMYLNYIHENMTEPHENEPVGMILCSAKDDAVVHYAMGGIKAKVFASEYLTALPDPETLRREIVATQNALEARSHAPRKRRR